MQHLRGPHRPKATSPDEPSLVPLPREAVSVVAGEAIKAVVEALTRLGSGARAWELADYIRVRLGITMRAGEVAVIRSQLRAQGEAEPRPEAGNRPGATVTA